jgi:hypothetical protein
VNTLNYTITEFDDTNKLVSVIFGDGSWAKIRLAAPLPQTIEALDDIVKQYAPAVEHLQAAQENTDLSFITAAVGVAREVERLVLGGRTTPAAQLEAEAEEAAAKMAEAEEARLRAFILAVLAEAGK